MHSFEVHSNESACRKSGRLGLEQVHDAGRNEDPVCNNISKTMGAIFFLVEKVEHENLNSIHFTYSESKHSGSNQVNLIYAGSNHVYAHQAELNNFRFDPADLTNIKQIYDSDYDFLRDVLSRDSSTSATRKRDFTYGMQFIN